MTRWVRLALVIGLLAHPAVAAETIRIATFNASLTRSGPGVLINRLAEGGDDQVKAVAEIIRNVRPDILLINEFDHDPVGLAADMFIEILGNSSDTSDGVSLPYKFDPPPNTGYLSGFDLNGDEKVSGPADAFGYGKFPGQYGMLLLSRFPLDVAAARDFSRLLWVDLPGASLPVHPDGTPFPSSEAQAHMRLSSKGHWDVPIDTDIGRLHVFASHPTPPVFDGPENMNGLRNGDEMRFWVEYINGTPFPDVAGEQAPRSDAPFVILGDLNADPFDGEGKQRVLLDLLNHRLVIDPVPVSDGAAAAAEAQAASNVTHRGAANADTADWRDDPGPGNLRVDYVLPSRDFEVVGSGVFWPPSDDPLFALIGEGKPVSSDHRLVWVDVRRKSAP